MDTTRRLSLTLLLVAPLITAQDSPTDVLSRSSLSSDLSVGVHPTRLTGDPSGSSVDLSLSSVSGEHLPDGVRPPRPSEEVYDDQEEIGTSTTLDSVTSSRRVEGKLGRERRGYDSSAEDMEVAEQVVFRPYFRHLQILADRKLDKEDAVRKQSLEPGTASGQAYYPYQYNYYYPSGAFRSQRSVRSYPYVPSTT